MREKQIDMREKLFVWREKKFTCSVFSIMIEKKNRWLRNLVQWSKNNLMNGK